MMFAIFLCLLVEAKVFNINVQKLDSAPDGFPSQMLVFNGSLVTPIIVDRGEDVTVVINNLMDEETTIHYHGIFQNGTNWYDGVHGVTQCAIAPGSTFAYNFKTDYQSGTFWYHSHYRAQYAKGLASPLIIRDPNNDPYSKEYTNEYIVMLHEWYHARNPRDLLEPFLSSENPDGAEPVPDSILINGKGRFDCTKKSQVDCNPNAPYDVFNVYFGKTYKLRIINTGAMGSYNFSIDGHTMDVIEADGQVTERRRVDILRIGVGQRYSVLVSRNMFRTTDNFWIRAVLDTGLWTNFQSSHLNPVGKAIWRYAGGKKDEPTTVAGGVKMLDPFKLLPFDKTLIAPDADTDFRVMFAIVPDEKNYSRAYVQLDGAFDYSNYQAPEIPTLFSVAQGKPLKESSNVAQLDPWSVIELTVYNDDAMPHTFHLHGHSFWVVKHGHSINLLPPPKNRWYDSKRGLSSSKMSYQNKVMSNFGGAGPSTVTYYDGGRYPIRDTIEVPPCIIKDSSAGEGGICGGTKGYVVLRFIANNPGVWLFHCHMEWHMQQGLAVTWIEDKHEIKSQGLSSIPPEVLNTCKK